VSICKLESSLAFLFAVVELAIVLSAISPNHLAIALDLASFKSSIISFILILEEIDSFSMEHSIYEISFVV
jgi:hypothetical protein